MGMIGGMGKTGEMVKMVEESEKMGEGGGVGGQGRKEGVKGRDFADVLGGPGRGADLGGGAELEGARCRWYRSRRDAGGT